MISWNSILVLFLGVVLAFASNYFRRNVSTNSSKYKKIEVLKYRFRFGAPPWRGNKFELKGSFLYAKEQSVGEVVESLIAQFCDSRNYGNRVYLLRQYKSSIPDDFDSGFHDETEELNSNDDRLAKQVIEHHQVIVVEGTLPDLVDIGIFTSEVEQSSSVADNWVKNEFDPLPSPEEVSAAVFSIVGSLSQGDDPTFSSTETVPLAARRKLIQLIDETFINAPGNTSYSFESDPFATLSDLGTNILYGSRSSDFKMLLSQNYLRILLGEVVFRELCSSLGANADAIAIRRTTAINEWISCHQDQAARTVQIPLEDGVPESGGNLVFLMHDGRIIRAPRLAGSLIAHNGDIVHCVSPLRSSIRYGLYLLKSR